MIDSLIQYRKIAAQNNLISDFAKKFLPLFICPKCRTPLTKKNGDFICLKGHQIPISNSYPDFTVFSKNALTEKKKQIEWHSHEADFTKVVLRPYNYNKTHAKAWLYHLKYFKRCLEIFF